MTLPQDLAHRLSLRAAAEGVRTDIIKERALRAYLAKPVQRGRILKRPEDGFWRKGAKK